MRVRPDEDHFHMARMFKGVRWGRSCGTHSLGVLLPSLVAALDASVCIEIGIFNAFTTEMFLRALDGREDALLISCDVTPHGCVRAQETHDSFLHSEVNHLVIRGKSKYVQWRKELASLRKSCCDLALIDGDHSEDGAYADLQAMAEVIGPNGAIIAHDYTESEPGVMAAVHLFLHDRGWPAIFFPDIARSEDKGFALIQKR